MNQRVSLILGSLAGAAAIHIALSACSGASSTPDARAQASACAQWEVATARDSFNLAATGKDLLGKPVSEGEFGHVSLVPAGWEPIGTGDQSGTYVLRRCAK